MKLSNKIPEPIRAILALTLIFASITAASAGSPYWNNLSAPPVGYGSDNTDYQMQQMRREQQERDRRDAMYQMQMRQAEEKRQRDEDWRRMERDAERTRNKFGW